MKRLPLAAALATFALHLVANPHYGFFRDELYFIICGRHPQLGYVDQPPVVPLLAAATQIFGHWLWLLRAIPALFAAGGIYVTCELVALFGGGRFAQLLAALVFFFTPVLLSFGMKAGTDEVGLFTWPLIALLFVQLSARETPRRWLVLGVTIGVSIQSKYSVLFYVAALIGGLLAVPERRILFTRGAGAAALVATAIAAPNAIWQLHYGLPILELLRNGQSGKNVIPSPALYLAQELLITNALLAAQWCIGLLWTLRSARFRFAGIAYLVLIAEMLIFHGKHYYPANIYPVLIAAGAVPIEAWTQRRSARYLLAAYVVLAGLVFVADALPILSEAQYVSYAHARGTLLPSFKKALETEHNREANVLPSDWADMHGWPEMAAAARAAYLALPPSRRREAVVFTGNYGEASAVAFFAPDVPVISEHNQFWLWGERNYSGETLVQINGSCFAADRLFRSRRRLATLRSRYALSYEAHAPIWLCTGIRKPLATVWPEIKDYE